MRMAIPEIDLDKCTGCGDCVELCLFGIVALVNDKATIVRPEDCNYCTDCEIFCSSGAIRCPFEIVLIKTETSENTEGVTEEEP
jgi:MinD superfamily P-loop ATPase